jgi:protein transport protein SEC61 subunit alpha
MLSHFYQLSEVLYNRFGKLTLIKLLGVWEGDKITSGLAWWISPPQDVAEWIHYPLRGLIYLIFVCATSALFAR